MTPDIELHDWTEMSAAEELHNRGVKIEELRAENRALREALKPFAKEAAAWGDKTPDDLHPSIDTFNAGRFGDYADFTIGDLRRARAALAAEPASGEAKPDDDLTAATRNEYTGRFRSLKDKP